MPLLLAAQGFLAAIGRAVDLMPLIEQGEWNAAIQRANTKPTPSQEKP